MTTSTLVERRGRRARRSLLVLSTILCSGMAAPAFATSPHPNIDANGVDLTDGSFNLRLPIASIGAGQTELPLIAYDGRTDNWSQLFATQSVSGTTTNVVINLGPQYDNFTITGASNTSLRGTGATLTVNGDNSVTYRTLDGLAIVFGNPADVQGGTSNLCDNYNNGACTRLALSMTGKTGMTVSLNWGVHSNCATTLNEDGSVNCTYSWRLGSVGNEAGYAIVWSFASNSVPVRQNPGPTWFQRTSAALQRNGATVGTVGYANPSTNVYTITTPGGKVWRITGSGQTVTGVRRPSAASDTTTIAYTGYAVNSVTKDGVTTSYSQTVSGNTVTEVVTDAQAHATTIVSDLTKYRTTSIKDALNRTTTFLYDSIGRPTEVTYPEGNKVQYAYDTRGNQTEMRFKAKPGSGLADIFTTASYPGTCVDASCNSPTWTKDANGNQTDYGYDTTTGLLINVRAPAAKAGANRPETRISYSTVAGVLVATGVSTCQTGTAPSCVGSPDEVKQTFAYDANLNATSVTNAAGDGSVSATTTRTFDAAGNLLTVDGSLPGAADTTTYRWSADREQLGVISADPDGVGALKRRAIKTSYDGDGQPTVAELGTVSGTTDTDWSAFASLQQSTASYDANGRKMKDVVTAGGTTYAVTQYSYDSVGRPECVAQRMNPATWSSLPGSACTLGSAGASGDDRIAKTLYDELSRATTVQSAFGTPIQSEEQQSYTANGLVASSTDGKGDRTGYYYDGFDRLGITRYPNPTTQYADNASDYEQLFRDANGNVTGRRLRDGQRVNYTYDALSRLTGKDLPGSELDVSYSYDLLSRPTGASTTAQTLTFGYDALGRNLTQTGPLGTVSSQYDTAGRRTRLTWPDTFYVTYDYLTTGQTTAIRENGATTGVGVLATFGYDDLGRRTTLTRGNGTSTTYAFDPVSRLGTLGQDLAGTGDDLTLGFAYNPASQIASTTRSNDAYAWKGHYNRSTAYTINGLNQATAAGSAAIGYDARGNTTSIGSAGYTYSAENMLLTGPSSAALVYDPLARLYQTSQTATTRLLYDGLDMIGEYNASNALQRRYVFGPGDDEPLVWYEGTGTADRRWMHADERGSVVAVTNGAGARIATNSYDEYGVPAFTNSGRFGYTGQAWLPELSMWYYKARIYAPTLGRFMQTDPIGYGDGLNWYNYVRSDPINLIDPTGRGCYPFSNHDGYATTDGDGTITYHSQTYTVLCFSDGSGGGGSYGDYNGGGGFRDPLGFPPPPIVPQPNNSTCDKSGPVIGLGLALEGYLGSFGGGANGGGYYDTGTGEAGLFGSTESATSQQPMVNGQGGGYGGSISVLAVTVARNIGSFKGSYETVGAGYGPFSLSYSFTTGHLFSPISVSGGVGMNAGPPTPITGHLAYGNTSTKVIIDGCTP